MTAKLIGSLEATRQDEFFTDSIGVAYKFEVPSVFPAAYKINKVDWLEAKVKEESENPFKLYKAHAYVNKVEGKVTEVMLLPNTVLTTIFEATEEDFKDDEEYILFCSYQDTYVVKLKDIPAGADTTNVIKVEDWVSYESQLIAKRMDASEAAFMSLLYEAF